MKKTFLLLIAFPALAADWCSPDSVSRSSVRTKAVRLVSRASKTTCFPQLSSRESGSLNETRRAQAVLQSSGRKHRILRPREDYLDARIRIG